MHQLKYTPDDVEIAVSATGKDVVQQRREKFQRMIEDACAGKLFKQIPRL